MDVLAGDKSMWKLSRMVLIAKRNFWKALGPILKKSSIGVALILLSKLQYEFDKAEFMSGK